MAVTQKTYLHPLPANYEITPRYRADDGAEDGTDGVYGDYYASLFLKDGVCDCSAA